MKTALVLLLCFVACSFGQLKTTPGWYKEFKPGRKAFTCVKGHYIINDGRPGESGYEFCVKCPECPPVLGPEAKCDV